MILNQTKKITVSEQELTCKTFLSQARGLMFRKKQNLIMIFPEERTVQLHNFFVFYPLEIVLLDQHFRVVEIKTDFRPFTFWNSQQKGKYLIELGLEEAKGKTNLGNKIVITEK